ncbi:hypothetical protein AQV86_01150 [Nanohaloarchaea archaeon SG9]|nr:hypothetical protein AQV86_01150 [Nanohaloarchaea archaeon SG9]
MERKAQVVDADYETEGGEVTVRAFCKTEEGKDLLVKDENFKPYFYAVPERDVEALREKVEEERPFREEGGGEELQILEVEEKELIDGNEEVQVLKVSTSVPANVPKLKNRLWDLEETEECREFDIPFYRRYMVDKGLRPNKWYSFSGDSFKARGIDEGLKVESIEEREQGSFEWDMLAFDLEVYEDEVIMASLYGKEYEKLLTTAEIEEEYVETVDSEKELIQRFVEIIEERNTDVLTGYNTDEYDFTVLRERSNEYGIELSLGRDGERMKFNRRGRFKGARLKGRMHLDLYPFIQHVLAPGIDSETLDLDSIAEEMLGRNKDEMSWEEMKKSWENREGLAEFARYALKDSELTFELAEEIVPQITELSRITGLIPFDTCRLTYGQLTENFLIREAHLRDMLVENRPSQDSRRKRQRQGAYSGGFVYTPDEGLYEDIVTLDFRSLYPTVMVAHNLSPDTLNIEECEEEFEIEKFDYSFCQDGQGFFPELIENLVQDRYEIKSEMREEEKDSAEYKALDNEQQAKKILANSFYGYLGYNGARWYSREAAEATTYMGREYIEETIEMAEEDGYEIVYGDTDSVFLKKDNIKQDIDGFLEKVNSELPKFMELEFEGFFKRGFFTSKDSGEGAKKKYALIDEEGKMKITGFEQVRRDWSPIAKRTQKEVLRKVLENKVDRAFEVAKDNVEALKDGEVPIEELKIYTTLTKPPEEYDSTSPHVEAAKKAKKRGKEIPEESTITYVITSAGGSISDQAEILEYAESYDADYYIENQVIPAVLRVLKVFGYTEGQLKGKGRQSGLGRFQ